MAEVLVLAERREGEVKRPVLEAVRAARRLAGAGKVSVLALGKDAASVAGAVGPYGADRVLALEDAALDLYAPELYAAALSEAAKSTGAALIVLAGTAMGRTWRRERRRGCRRLPERPGGGRDLGRRRARAEAGLLRQGLRAGARGRPEAGGGHAAPQRVPGRIS